MARVLITGGTGMVGRALTARLLGDGHEVTLLSRHPRPSKDPRIREFSWDVHKGTIDASAFEGVEHIVHLAGAGVADQRWTKKRKEEIISSRVESMRLLEQEILKYGLRLKSFSGASAVGYYGMITAPTVFTEEDQPATNDFLVECCTLWEQSYANVSAYTARHAVIRIGVVLSKEGGALRKMLPLFRFGLGSPLGSGQQYMPWIHLDDIAEVFYQAIFNEQLRGTYNAATPESITNLQFSKAIAHALHKPFIGMHVPAVMLKLMFGEMAGTILEGSRVSCSKLISTGFRFKYGKVEAALEKELG